MDTRRKIVGVAELPDKLKDGQWTAIVGLFDPLTALQAERIAAHARTGRKILAVIRPGADTLLSQEARAVLVAALRDVELVVASLGTESQPLWRDYPDLSVDDDEAAELSRSGDFAQYILQRAASSHHET